MYLSAQAETVDPESLDVLHWKLAFEIEEEYAASINQLSAIHYDSDARFQGSYAMLPGGYSQIAEILAQGLEIQYECCVTNITNKEDRVCVKTADGRTWAADHVVCTLPLGVLKTETVMFDPPLSAPKRSAIERIGFGLLDKIVMLFDTPFWEDDSLDGFGQVWITSFCLDRPSDRPFDLL